MILNFYFLLINFKNNIIIFLLLYFPVWLKFLTSNWIDTYSRIYLNDFFLNTYYSFWTSFWFIPSFVSIILYLIVWFWGVKIVKLNTIFFITTCIIILNEFNGYWFLNLFNWQVYINSENVNILLINSINKYHPFLFYVSLILLIQYFIFTYSNKYNILRTFWLNQQVQLLLKKRFTILFIIVYTLFLGSWWALQEGSWGGWWNWDPSEVFGLVLMLFLVKIIHNYIYSRNSLTSFFEIRIFSSFLLCLYLFIQLNFNLVSHNFGIKIDQFVNTTQILLILLIFFLIKTYFFFSNYTLLHIQYLYNFKNLPMITLFSKYLIIILLSLLVSVECIFSFYPLINDFLWKLLKLNFINIFININSLIIIVLVLNVLFFWNFKNFNIIIGFWLLNQPHMWILVLSIFLYIQKKNTYYMHLLICFFLVLNITILGKTFVTWEPLLKTSNVNFFNPINDYYVLMCKTNSIFLEISLLETFNNYLREVTWNFFNENTSPEIHSFLQSHTNQNSIQTLFNGLFSQRFSIHVSDISISPCLTVFYFILISYLNIFFKKLIIF